MLTDLAQHLLLSFVVWAPVIQSPHTFSYLVIVSYILKRYYFTPNTIRTHSYFLNKRKTVLFINPTMVPPYLVSSDLRD